MKPVTFYCVVGKHMGAGITGRIVNAKLNEFMGKKVEVRIRTVDD